jgi:hypothetical protein
MDNLPNSAFAAMFVVCALLLVLALYLRTKRFDQDAFLRALVKNDFRARIVGVATLLLAVLTAYLFVYRPYCEALRHERFLMIYWALVTLPSVLALVGTVFLVFGANARNIMPAKQQHHELTASHRLFLVILAVVILGSMFGFAATLVHLGYQLGP